MKVKILFKIIFLVLFINNTVYARWAKLDDASFVTLSYNENINIDKNGYFDSITEEHIQILKEQGRAVFSSFSLYYNESSEKFDILEAKTIYQGKEYNVLKNQIEDKPLASSAGGFDQIRQILISFPNAQIGSQIYIKYRVKKKPIADGYYSDIIKFVGLPINKANIKIDSKIPLYIKINDPQNIFSVEEKQNKEFNITLKKPSVNFCVNESRYSVFDDSKFSWISISSVDNWQDYARIFNSRYNEVINQKLPSLLESIYQSAKNIKEEVLQINTVTSLLNEQIHYMGDWRSIDGKFFPRDLKKNTDLKVADCKEFSSMTGAILNKLGFKAQIAFVARGDVYNLFQDNPPFGNSKIFNHALLKVTNKEGKIYWIDPTNALSMADGIFNDIANKNVLVLNSTNTGLEKISEINPNHSQVITIDKIYIKDETLEHKALLELKGEKSQILYQAGLYLSEQNIKEEIFRKIVDDYLQSSDKIFLPKLGSRIVKDAKIEYEYSRNNRIIKTNLGRAISIKYSWLDNIIDSSNDNVLDIIINGGPAFLKKFTIIKGIKVKNIETLNYYIKTPWLEIKRTCSYEGNDSVILDEVKFNKRIIKASETKTKQYQKLRDDLIKYYQNFIIIID